MVVGILVSAGVLGTVEELGFMPFASESFKS